MCVYVSENPVPKINKSSLHHPFITPQIEQPFLKQARDITVWQYWYERCIQEHSE